MGLCCFSALAAEHFNNADFSEGFTNWGLHVHKSLKVQRSIKDGVLSIQIDEAGKHQHVQLIHKVKLVEGQQYRLSFEARQDGKEVKTAIACLQLGKPYKNYGLNQTATFSNAWARHSFTFAVKGLTQGQTPTIRLFLGNQTSVQLRNFSLVDIAKDAKKTRTKSGAGEEYDGVALKQKPIVKADDPKVFLRVHEGQILQPVPPKLFGFNHNWLWSNRLAMENSDTEKPVISPEFLKLLKGLPLPLNRMSGSISQTYHWKWAMGPMSERQPQKLVGHDTLSKKPLGPLEWVDSTLQIDPKATFSWTFNLKTETPQDHADLAELMVGDPKVNANGGMNWAQKRVDYGIVEPIPVVIWELANELDWGRGRDEWPVERYINSCREIIAAVRRVHPQARFAAFASTAAWSDVHKKTPGGWKAWHRKILKELGDQIDWIAFHPYYHGHHTAYVEKYLDTIRDDIVAITGSNRIKVYISEHARWPARPKNKPWSTTWKTTHDLSGSLAAAEFLNRCLQRPEIEAAAYHSFSGGPWGVFYRDKQSEQLYTTGIYDLFVQLGHSLGKQVVQTQLTGTATQDDFTFTASAMTSDDQSLRLILVNRSEYPRIMTLTTDKQYRSAKARIFTASNMSDYNTAQQRPIATANYPMNSADLSQIHVPARCMLTVQLMR